jgi:protein-S-isoprenylcysteine O-methyltransferase Ste14
MLLNQRLVNHGGYLSRWRSYVLPALLIPACFALPESGAVERHLGAVAEAAWNMSGLVIAYLGCLLRVATVGFVAAGTSGRNTRDQRATELNTTGLYSVVRNPLYLANGLTVIGLALEIKVAWLMLLVVAVLLVFYERVILAEEAFLERRFGNEYRTWAAKTPATLPALRLWRPPSMAFCPRTVLRREYHGFYAVTLTLVLIEFGNDVIGEGMPLLQWVREDYPWLILGGFGTVVYLALRTIRTRTNWLRVPGR